MALTAPDFLQKTQTVLFLEETSIFLTQRNADVYDLNLIVKIRGKSTYSKFIVEVANSKNIYPKAFVRTERVYPDLLAHFKKLTPKYWIFTYVFLVLHGKLFKTLLEFSQLLCHFLKLLLLNLRSKFLGCFTLSLLF